MLLLVSRSVCFNIVIAIRPFGTLKTFVTDSKGTKPPNQCDAGKEPPSKHLPFRFNLC